MKRIYMTVGLAALLITGCGGGVYYATTPPPPVRVEAAFGPAPGPGYVWVNGYWGWRGSAYAWMPGRYVRPPHPHSVWVEPRWERRGERYRFYEGRWR
jgi:hypothetical protein